MAQPSAGPAEPEVWMAAEPSPRRVRVEFGGQTVAESRRVMLFRQSRGTPVYYFPRADVKSEFLVDTGEIADDGERGKAAYANVVVGNRVAEKAARSYPEPLAEWPQRPQYVTFNWDDMDHWYEEAEEVIRHPRDPYHRVDVTRSDRHVKIVLSGQVLADTTRPSTLFETGFPVRYYIPREDIRMDLLESMPDLHTRCPYKGEASYWKLKSGGPEIVWAYLEPLPECPKIKGMLSFYQERVDEVWIDDEPEPRPLLRFHTARAKP